MTVSLTDTTTIALELPATIRKEWHATEFDFHPDKMDATTLAAIFTYGLRVYNDKYAKKADTTSGKAAVMRLAVDAANNGEAWEGRAASVQLTPLEVMELTIAKEALKKRFKNITGKTYVKDMVAASDAVAPYYKGTVWIDAKVREWINSDLGQEFDVTGKAKAELAEMEKMSKVDVSDLI